MASLTATTMIKQEDLVTFARSLLDQAISSAVTGNLIVILVGAFWGLVLLGLAIWLSNHNSPGGALACLSFSGAYFWFTWDLYRAGRH